MAHLFSVPAARICVEKDRAYPHDSVDGSRIVRAAFDSVSDTHQYPDMRGFAAVHRLVRCRDVGRGNSIFQGRLPHQTPAYRAMGGIDVRAGDHRVLADKGRAVARPANPCVPDRLLHRSLDNDTTGGRCELQTQLAQPSFWLEAARV